jgi:hypothetical protein
MSYFDLNNVHPNAARLLPAAVAQLRLFAPRYHADIIPLHGKRLLSDVCPDHVKVTEELEVFELLTSEICAKILAQVDNTAGLTGSRENHCVTRADNNAEWSLSLYVKVLSEKKWLSFDSLGFSLFKDGQVFLPVGAGMLSRIVTSLEDDLRNRGVLVVSAENIITEAGACAAKKAGFRLWANSDRQWGDYIIQYQGPTK